MDFSSAPGMYEGRVFANVVERFRPIAKKALQRVIREIVRRSVAAIDEGVTLAKKGLVESIEQEPIEDLKNIEGSEELESQKDIGIMEEEFECFAIIKQQFESSALASKTIYNPSNRKEIPIEIAYKNTSAYCNIYFNKPHWWKLSYTDIDEWIKTIEMIPDEEYSWVEQHAYEFAGRLLVPIPYLLKDFEKAVKRAELAGFTKWDALDKDRNAVAIKYIASSICRKYGVSSDVIARRIDRESLWPPNK